MAVFAANFYLPNSNVPKVFLDADKQILAKERERQAKIVTEPKVVPMPYIHGVEGVKGPIVVTEDWYVKEEKKRLAKIAKDKRKSQIEMMHLIAQRDRINSKLGELDPAKKKDSKKMVFLNIKLKDIDAELKLLQDQTGINMDELESGSQFSRFVGRFKRKVKKIVKKVKKFYETYKEPILSFLAVAIPAAIGIVVKLICGLF